MSINKDIYNKYLYFGYDDNELFCYHLDFLLNNLYMNIKVVEEKTKRLNQQEFRQLLLDRYGCCIISNNNCYEELEACHIIEVKNNGDDDINNGLLLERNLHSTFDKNLWCINPDTLLIEIKDTHKGSINKFKNVKININMNPFLYFNLKQRYNLFKLS